MDCYCKDWARDGRLPITSHHYDCPKYAPVPEMLTAMRDLLTGIRKWSADCDGIHEDVWDAYCAAEFMANGKVVEDKEAR